MSVNQPLTALQISGISGSTLNVSGNPTASTIDLINFPGGYVYGSVTFTGLTGALAAYVPTYTATELELVGPGPPVSTWAVGSANWNSSSSWTGGVPNSKGPTAVMTNAGGGVQTTATLDVSATVGTLTLGKSDIYNPTSGFTISPPPLGTQTLTLDNNSGGTRRLTSSAACITISAPVEIADGTLLVSGIQLRRPDDFRQPLG